MVQAGQPPRMGLPQKFVFGIGSAAFGIKDGGFNLLLLIFYNQIVGLPASSVGFAIMVALMVDAFADPVIGAISDHWRSPLGRRHPFMYASAVPVAILYFLLWSPPAWSAGAVFYYLLFVTIALRISIACYEIPSIALVAEIAPDYDERTTILSIRLFCQAIIPAAVGLITFFVFLPNTPAHPNGMLNRDGYLPYAILASLSMAASILISSWGTRSRIPYLKNNAHVKRPTLGDVFRMTFRSLGNPSFLVVTMFGVFAAMAGGLGNALGTYMGLYFWKFSPQQLSTLVFGLLLAVFIALPLSPWLSSRFGKKRAGIWLAFIWVFANGVLPVLKLSGLLPPDGSTALLALFFGSALISTTLFICAIVLILSMVTDANEDNQLRTGQRSEGVFAAAGSFVNKTVSGVGVYIAGLLLDFVHFPQGATPQNLDPEIIRNLVLIFIPTQFVLLFIGVTFLTFYRIDRNTHERTLEKLSQVAAAEGEAAPITDVPRLG
jgi:Na+/melibiose symporter-like transporter